MDRRTFISTAAAAGAAATGALAADVSSSPPWRRAELATEIDVSAHPGAAQTWIPVVQSVGPYQRASAPKITCTGAAQVVHDPAYGTPIVRARWAADGPKTLSVVQTVQTRDRGPVATPLSPAERAAWLKPTDSLPLDGIVHDTAMQIVGARTDPKEKLGAIYEWVVDNTFRDPATRGCGLGDIKSLLVSRRLGGKCADINSLMTALCRASGVPARDVYGIRFAPSAYQKCLGSSGDISHAQHCRSEAWIEGLGWFPVDPADVRKVVLEANLPLASPPVQETRRRLFGSWEMNWVGYNSATDLALPGAPRPMAAHFLMYPYGMTATSDFDWLDPSAFDYRITSKVVA
ncbi:transglutaminase family protein [Caulobacter sp. S45]|uniref:transglutaminase-like domain-containing protein n=1 Tax=Caulobacter sp. S45 TaxID=1641861 RepID=UPI0015751CE7|nr:transglutaminase-like domain-containing protein [Caulobacter sp. S45]